MATIDCDHCAKPFSMKICEIARSFTAGRRMFCSRSCAATALAISRGDTLAYRLIQSGLPVDVVRCMRIAYHHTKKNAKTRQIDFTLSRDEFLVIAVRAAGRCEISAIPFTLGEARGRYERRPWAPSIDRIDSAKGYSVTNCRLVCIAVNLAMNTWGIDTLQTMARALYLNSKAAFGQPA